MTRPQPDDHLAAIWKRIRDELESSLPHSAFDLWLAPLQPAGRAGSELFLSAPDRVRHWVERRYLPMIQSAAQRADATIATVSLLPADAANDVPPTPGNEQGGRTPQALPLNPAHDFNRFVIGPGNRLAHAAALAVAESPGEAYNPLFLHGPPGLGKTHLMGAIAAYMNAQHPQLTVHYTTAEQFTSDFVDALRTEGPERFKRRYREIDALLIDDVQVLEGKPRTEEEFVHTFNALFEAGKQIVLSSDRPPQALARLEERLRDRFEWGLTAAIESPDLSTRIAVLWRLLNDADGEVGELTVLREIASRVPGNVRRLEGAMTRVLALSSVFGEPLDHPIVDRALTRRTEPAHASSGQEAVVAPSVTAIQEAVCSVLAIPRSEMLSSKRTPAVARARQMAMYLARDLTPLSLAQIAREFDRDHTTVMHAIRSVESRLEPGSQALGDIHKVRARLGEEWRADVEEGSDVHLGEDDPQP